MFYIQDSEVRKEIVLVTLSGQGALTNLKLHPRKSNLRWTNFLTNTVVILTYFLAILASISGIWMLKHGGFMEMTTLSAFVALELINISVLIYAAVKLGFSSRFVHVLSLEM